MTIPVPISQSDVDAFERDGFLVVPGFPVDVEQVLRELDRLIAQDLDGLPRSDVYEDIAGDRTTLKQIQRLHEHAPLFRELLDASPFMTCARRLLGQPVIGRNVQYFDKPAETSRATPPHQDGFYFMLEPPEAVTLWFALDDVGEENGCVRYVRGSHRGGLRDHLPSGVLGFSQELAAFGEPERRDEIPCPCVAGTLIAHHALTIHRAEPNGAGVGGRRALGLIYYRESARVEEAAHQAYQQRLAAALSREGRI